MTSTTLSQVSDYFIGQFGAMKSPCEILVDTMDPRVAQNILRLAFDETKRIENKLSRYLSNNVIFKINNSSGQPVQLDQETAQLIEFAHRSFQISEGLFDITSGVLRKIWKFDGSNNIPLQNDIDQLLPLIGWDKVIWQSPMITLPEGMEIDLGGIGKEYSVDRSLKVIREKFDVACLINYGGDISALGLRKNKEPWTVGIEGVDQENKAVRMIQMREGGLTTSGDSKRFLLKDGKRYGHILNPKTGWPVENAPRSVTVAAGTCTEAGFLSTLGMLQGKNAEQFLSEAGVQYWCFRG